MSLPGLLCQFGLKHLFDVTSKEVVDWIDSRFEDSSRAVLRAVFDANRRSWVVVGLALTDRTFLDRLRNTGRESDLKAARDDVRRLVGVIAIDQRAHATDELTALHTRHRNAIPDALNAAEVALRRFSDPAGVAAEADRAAASLPDSIATDAPNLAAVLRHVTDGKTPLFQTLYRYHFRKLVAKNAELNGLLLRDELRALADVTDARTAGILDQFDALFDTLAGVEAKLKDIDAKLDKLLDERNVTTNTRDPLKVSVTNERELAQLRQWRDELRNLPPDLVDSALFAKLGDALAAARMFGEARQAHKAAARAATDTAARAEAEFKAYRDACEQEEWEDALKALVRAAELDPGRFSPFPFNRYEPVGILGTGGFGTVIRCRQRLAKGREVAVKTFHAADLGREVDAVFAEAHALLELADPAIVKILHWDYADSAEARPFLVMEYFPGVSLATWLKREGRLSVPDFLAVAGRVAAAMTAAHALNILHRDLKPGNVLLQRSGNAAGWDVRVIDFGLAVRFSMAQASISTSLPHRTRRDQSFAGTLEYSSPEQKGLIAGTVGPRSDVYSFGKTMLEALLGTTEPTARTWKVIPEVYREPLQDLLERCIERKPTDRHAGFDAIVAALSAIDAAEKANREMFAREVAERTRHADQAVQAERLRAAAEAVAARNKVEQEGSQDAERHLQDAKRKKQTPAKAKRKSRAEEEALKKVEEHTRKKAEEEAIACDPLHHSRVRTAGDKIALKLPSDVPIKLAWCPPTAKPFLMGSNHPNGYSDEKPIHKVTLTKGFFMGIHPVTQAQWKAVMGSDPSYFKGPNRPVECVSWNDCQDFCKKLTALLKGRGTVRLPTEAEWEYACRAGTTTEYYFGENFDPELINCMQKVNAWTIIKTGFGYGKGTNGVSSFRPNPWGLHDVHGNVWEWCKDGYSPYTGTGEDQTDPCHTKQSIENYIILRGGAWRSDPGCCRAACRRRSAPSNRCSSFGFRVCFHLD